MSAQVTSFQSSHDGILPDHRIKAAIDNGIIRAACAFDADQIQPASLDLRLGSRAWRVRASFLPGPAHKVEDKLDLLKLHEIDLTAGAVLETGCVYVVPLQETLALPDTVSASTNPKSSTGRIDVFTRVIVDKGGEFDRVPAGYQGALYAEISPRTFPVRVRKGSRLGQIRFRIGNPRLDDAALAALHKGARLVDEDNPRFSNGLGISIDLAPRADNGGIIGYRAKRHTGIVDMDEKNACVVTDYWEPVMPASQGRHLILDPNEFYILVSREAVHIPAHTAAEMVAYDPLVGEFRVHYAGFFDPGFGHHAAGGKGSRAVLEVRSHEVPFILDDGQNVARLIYESMLAPPDTLYGTPIGSHYQAQGLKLSKHFKPA